MISSGKTTSVTTTMESDFIFTGYSTLIRRSEPGLGSAKQKKLAISEYVQTIPRYLRRFNTLLDVLVLVSVNTKRGL